MITAAGEISSDLTEGEERQIERNQRVASGEEKKAGAEESDDWEDIDCDDGDMAQVEEAGEEEEKDTDPKEETKSASDFDIIDGDSSVVSGTGEPSSSSFSLIEGGAQSSNVTADNKTESF